MTESQASTIAAVMRQLLFTITGDRREYDPTCTPITVSDGYVTLHAVKRGTDYDYEKRVAVNADGVIGDIQSRRWDDTTAAMTPWVSWTTGRTA